MEIILASTEEEYLLCFPVMKELRTQLDEDTYTQAVKRMMDQDGFQLAYIQEGGKAVSIAGFRCGESFAWGRYIYVDDLITASQYRSKGYGRAMMDWLVAHAKSLGCGEMHLDSGVQRYRAHHFYLSNKMLLSNHHFKLNL
jgi:GNAT superfamily N-acetyltransferase